MVKLQVEHKTQKGTVLFVKIENDYSVAGLNDGHIYFWTSSLLQSMGDYPLCVEIPKGNFEYIGLTSDVTEEMATRMVDDEIDWSFKTGYVDYTNRSTVCGLSALESFKSLMQHLQVYEVNPLPDPEDTMRQVDGYIYYGASDDEFEEYENINNRCGKWVVLFKEN